MRVINLLKKVRRYLQWKLYLKRNYDKNSWYFIMRYGIGDIYMVSSLMSKFIEQNGEVTLIIEKRNQIFIPKLFNNNIKTLCNNKTPVHLINEFGNFQKGVPVVLHPNDLYSGKLLEVIGLNGTSLLDIYKIILGIKLYVKPDTPEFPALELEVLNEFFSYHKLPKFKTVILCPKAQSIEEINLDFWIVLAYKIKEVGLMPVFMGTSTNLKEFRNIDFKLEQSKNICDASGYIISIRSGFCDLISTSTAKKVILYTDIDWYSGKLISSTSLTETTNTTEGNLLEIEFKNSEVEKEIILRDIIKFIHE